MKSLRMVSTLLCCAVSSLGFFWMTCLIAAPAFGQWKAQKSNTGASLHGLSVVNANVIWASGTGGTFVRTTDGGETWQAGTVLGGGKLDFRDVYAVDAKTAYLFSFGDGNEGRIYKTTDAGKTWALQYTEQNPKASLDCMAFWNGTRGIVVGDPVDGKSELLTTSDGGAHWAQLPPESLPPAKAGEGSPASGTCIGTYSEKNGKEESWHAWFVTEHASRVFHTADAGKTWTASDAPLITGENKGAFSIAVMDAHRLVIVGGDYDHPQVATRNAANSNDGGKTWEQSSRRPAGYRWCVAIVPGTPGPTVFAVGPTGMDYSIDGGKNWEQMNDVRANTIAFADAHHGWAVGGQKGQILKFDGAVRVGEPTTSEGAAGNSFRDCSECPEMIVVPTGHFIMGSSAEEKSWAASHGGSMAAVADEAPQHQVSLPSFALGKYDVTRGEYAAFVRETKYPASDGCGSGRAIFKWQKDPKVTWENPGFTQTDRDPVVCVSWQDAKAYVAWLNAKVRQKSSAAGDGPYRLPSESEWEYAARAGTTTKFFWGNDVNGARAHAWFNADSGCKKAPESHNLIESLFCEGGQTHPVGAKLPNAFGLYDMAGNVWQWTEDCYDNSYTPAPADGRANGTPSSDVHANDSQGNCLRVDRGGSWMFPAWLLRPATRERNPADYRNNIMGFRVAKALP